MEKWEDEGRATPLRDRPESWPELAPVWELFHELHRTRRAGFAGAEALGLGDIEALMRMRGVPDGDRADLLDGVLALDAEWLSWARERQSKERDTRPKGAARG